MSKIENTIGLLEAGIRAESLRQKAIASNIANLETPGYRRVDVKFADALINALESSGDINLADIQAEIYHTNNTPVNSKGNDVNLETEVGQMVQNTLRHTAYIRLLNKKYQQMTLAMNMK